MDRLILSLAEVSLSNWIAFAAAIIALASFFISFGSLRISRKSYRLASQAAEAARPSCSGYLFDAFRYRAAGKDKVAYIFSILIENRSTTPNSISSVELRLPYTRDGHERVGVFDVMGAKEFNLEIKNEIHIPAALSPRGSLTGNCCFLVPVDTLEKSKYDLHVLRVGFVDGPFVELNSKLIMDVVDAGDLEKKRKVGLPI